MYVNEETHNDDNNSNNSDDDDKYGEDQTRKQKHDKFKGRQGDEEGDTGK